MITVIASGKGGVGKTTVSANLSAALSKRGKRILAVDADVNMRNLDLVFGIQDSVVWDSGDAFAGRCAFEECLTAHERFEGLYVAAAPYFMPAEKGISEYIAKNIYELDKSGAFAHIIVDCPSGISDGVSAFLFRGVRLAVIATPDMTSVRDSQKLVSEARKRGVADDGIIVNRVRASSIKRGLSPDIDFIMDSVSARLFGLIPEDRKTSELAFCGVLATERERTRSKRAYDNIAARLDGEYRELYGFWK